MKKFQMLYQIVSILFLVNCINAIDLNVKLRILNGNQLVDPLSLTYYWPLNSVDSTLRKLNLQLTLQIGSLNITNFQLVQPASITVKCSQSPNSDANFVRLNFVDKVINDLTKSINTEIEFSISQSGQPPVVSCIGQLNNFPQQNIGGYLLDNINFVRSSYTLLNVQKYPTISFTSSQELLPLLNISPFSNSFFEIYFRDQTLYETAVSCTISSSRNVLFSQSDSTTIIQAPVGSTVAKIPYIINTSNLILSNSFIIRCSAQSNGVNGIEQQYQPSFATASATVSYETPKIDLLSQSSKILITGSNFRIPLKLNPNKQSSANITLECEIRRFKSLIDLNNFQNGLNLDRSCPSNLPDQVSESLADYSYTNQDFDWFLVDSLNNTIISKRKEFKFDNIENNDYIQIERRPLVPVKKSLNVFLSLFCCDKSILTSSAANIPKYQSALGTISIFLPSSSNPNMSYPQEPTDSQLLDPNYSPCTCDLTVNACDLNCCCDPNCSNDDKLAANLNCRNRVRTVFEKTIDKWTCTDIYNDPKIIENDWFPIICIHFNTTVLLGNFYSPKIIDDLITNRNEQFLQIIDKKVQASYNTRSRYLNDPYYSNQGVTSSDLCSLDSNMDSPYKYGSCLKIAEKISDRDASDFFRFPQASKNFPTCYYDSPVKYLSTEGRVFCPNTLKNENCVKNGPFDANTYLNEIIIANEISGDKIQISSSNIEYFKCDKYFLSGSLQSLQTSPAIQCQSDGSTCKFQTNTKLFDNVFIGICNNNNWTSSSNEIIDEIKKNIPSDYYMKPDPNYCKELSYDEATRSIITQGADQCLNAVIGVKHVLFWDGGNLNKTLTRVILSDVSYDGLTSKPIKQMFELKWNHLPNKTFDTLEFNSLTSVTDYDDLVSSSKFLNNQKSGTKGYTIGKPIISGFRVNGSNTNVDISSNYRLSAYKILNGKLCGTLSKLERETINFGHNKSSSCVVKVTKSDLADNSTCLCLKRIIFNKLNDYFAPSNLISINGNPNMNEYVESDWLNIYPLNRYLKFTDVAQTDPNTGACLNVPYKLSIWFFYTNAGKSDGKTIREITGTYISYGYKNWNFICKSDRRECFQDPLIAQDFNIEFEANFINVKKDNSTWMERCKTDKYPSQACLEEVFWTWPKDYKDPNFFYLYTVHLGLLFGIFALLTIHFILYGLMCPC